MMHAKATKNILDVIDEVRGRLGGGLQGSQQAFYEELLASLPQFVAVGPQSAGKRAPLTLTNPNVPRSAQPREKLRLPLTLIITL